MTSWLMHPRSGRCGKLTVSWARFRVLWGPPPWTCPTKAPMSRVTPVHWLVAILWALLLWQFSPLNSDSHMKTAPWGFPWGPVKTVPGQQSLSRCEPWKTLTHSLPQCQPTRGVITSQMQLSVSTHSLLCYRPQWLSQLPMQAVPKA